MDRDEQMLEPNEDTQNTPVWYKNLSLYGAAGCVACFLKNLFTKCGIWPSIVKPQFFLQIDHHLPKLIKHIEFFRGTAK